MKRNEVTRSTRLDVKDYNRLKQKRFLGRKEIFGTVKTNPGDIPRSQKVLLNRDLILLDIQPPIMLGQNLLPTACLRCPKRLCDWLFSGLSCFGK